MAFVAGIQEIIGSRVQEAALLSASSPLHSEAQHSVQGFIIWVHNGHK